MEKPDFLFLDEPTNALDESGVELVHNIIKEEAKRGAIVLLASHSKEDIENLCDKKYIMAGGKLIEGESL
ncbi:putative ABC transporter ATP-binding protein YxlF [compost metagenome]